jgi:hypothetical protein
MFITMGQGMALRKCIRFENQVINARNRSCRLYYQSIELFLFPGIRRVPSTFAIGVGARPTSIVLVTRRFSAPTTMVFSPTTMLPSVPYFVGLPLFLLTSSLSLMTTPSESACYCKPCVLESALYMSSDGMSTNGQRDTWRRCHGVEDEGHLMHNVGCRA